MSSAKPEPLHQPQPVGERETEAALASHGRDGKPKTPVGQLSVPSECRQKSPCLALTYPDGIPALGAAWSPLSITAWHSVGDRQMDRRTDRSASLSGHHMRDGQMDRQTTLHRSAGITRVTDGRTGRDGQTDSRSLSSISPAAHRLPTSSILWKMLPRGAEGGSHPLALVGPLGSPSVGSLTPGTLWHPN